MEAKFIIRNIYTKIRIYFFFYILEYNTMIHEELHMRLNKKYKFLLDISIGVMFSVKRKIDFF